MSSSLQIRQKMLVNSNLAKNLVLARKATDLTQSDLAEKANISRATVAQIESGESDPRLSTIVDIATSLKISPVLLMMGEEEFDSLIQLSKNFPKMDISEENVEKMKYLLASGLKKHKMKAAQIGVASTIGLSSVGAAIGSVLFPGIGTIFGASFAALIADKISKKKSED